MSKNGNGQPQYTEVTENVKFISWGKKGAKENSYVVDKDESIEVMVADKKLSVKYTTDDKQVYVYHLRERGSKPEDATLILIPPTDLANKFKLGGVEVGDQLKITFLGEEKTGKGKPMKKFSLGIIKGN